VPPSLKTRSIILTRSGNRCALCRRKLVVDATDTDAPSQTGAIAHIHAEHVGGPRYDPSLPEEYVNGVENLLVLCHNDHKVVDDQPEHYTAEKLRGLKCAHEKWVDKKLEEEKEDEPGFMERRATGKEIVDLLGGVQAYLLDHEPPETSEEADAIGVFLQLVRDWGECWSDIEPVERVRVGFDLQGPMTDLENMGYWVFSGQKRLKYHGVPLVTLSVIVAKATNPDISLKMADTRKEEK